MAFQYVMPVAVTPRSGKGSLSKALPSISFQLQAAGNEVAERPDPTIIARIDPHRMTSFPGARRCPSHNGVVRC
jgi:hypothetical protein